MDKKYSTELLHFAGGYPDWLYKEHHAGFDIVSNRVLEVLRDYLSANNDKFKKNICFWVTGHSMGAGVSNLVGAKLVDGIKYKYTIVNEDDFVTELLIS